MQVKVISLQDVLIHHNSLNGMGLSNESSTKTQDSNSVDSGTALFAQIYLPQNLGFSPVVPGFFPFFTSSPGSKLYSLKNLFLLATNTC